MPTAANIAAEIAGRARRIGWEVETGGGGQPWLYRIVCPDNTRVQLHSSPSDTNWVKVVMRALDSAGFSEAEAKWKEKDEKLRLERIEEDKIKNAKALQAAQTRASLVSKAAGPYGPQVATVDWIFNRHMVPETKRVLVTPELAKKILEELNISNRPLRSGRVEYWGNLINQGRWLYTHQGIAFDVRPGLQDGQHRLAAAVRENFTLDINVTVGMPIENFTAIDTGANRSGSDALAVEGKENTRILAAAAKLIVIFNRYGSEMREGARTRIPNDELVTAADKYGERLTEAVRLAKEISTKRTSPRMSPNALAAGIFLISHRLPEDDLRVAEFIRGYREGVDLSSGDARIALRTYMFNIATTKNRRVPVEDQLGIFIKAWNAWINHRTMVGLTFRRDEQMPRVFLPSKSTHTSYEEDL